MEGEVNEPERAMGVVPLNPTKSIPATGDDTLMPTGSGSALLIPGIVRPRVENVAVSGYVSVNDRDATNVFVPTGVIPLKLNDPHATTAEACPFD